MNCIKRSLVGRETKRGVRAFGGVGASSLTILDYSAQLWLASSSCFLVGSTKKLMQKLPQIQNLEAITKNKNLNMIFLNELADLLSIKLLEL